MLAKPLVLAALALYVSAQEDDDSSSSIAIPGTSTTATTPPSAFGGISSTTSRSTSTFRSGTSRATTTAPSVSAQTTITGIIGTYTSGIVASVVAANPCDTTLAIQCTDMGEYYCSKVPDFVITVTQGPSKYEFDYSTVAAGEVISVTQSCALDYESSTIRQAVCSAFVSVSARRTRTQTSSVKTLTASPVFNVEEILITAGAEKLPSAGSSCTATEEEGAAATQVSQVYKVLVPVGMAVVGALVFNHRHTALLRADTATSTPTAKQTAGGCSGRIMSQQQQQQQQAIDPALRSTPNESKPQLHYQHQPPPHFSAPPANLNIYPTSPPQPYYQYPTPQTHTPHAPGTGTGTATGTAAPSSASHSNQTSPQNAGIAYEEHNEQDARDHSPDDGNAAPGEDPKRPRACEACRGLKVRCDQDPAHPELPCRRCAKAGRQCIITAPSRKRQKKADSRVAELEKKLDALTAVLQQHQQQQQAGHSQQPHYGSPYANAAPTAQMAQQYAQQHVPPRPSAPSPMQPSTASMQPPQKRRRTEEDPQQTPTLDEYAEQSTAHSSRYQGKSGANKFPQPQDPWGPNADMMRYLTHRSPEDFMNRINSLVNPDLGVSIFNRYVTKMSPHMPAVVFPQGTTAEQVWKEKPILYVCILSAGSSGILHPDTCKQLSRETIQAIADCVVCSGAKSLELIQAMQVIALWYKPPEKPEQTNFYQIMHMAAVMAIDIGLGKRFNASKARRGFGGPHSDYAPGTHLMLPINSDTIEARRAWLGCYYLCASVSMVLRRPNLVHWTKYMQECVDILETSSEALPSDKLFCQHIKIQHICEEVSVQFLMDDSTASISITDPKVTYTLNVLENDLKKWSEEIPTELKSHSGLRFFEHVASLYLHEIALHFNHNVDDFRLPFTEESLKSVNNSTEKLTQNQIAALEACRKAAHGLLDHMLSFDADTVKVLPMLIFFVRCTYAIVILIKMHVAITTPGSEISKMMTTDDINAEYYLDGLLSMFSSVASEQEFRPHPKVLRILSVLKDWFRKHKENVTAQSRGEQLPHPPTSTQQEAQNGGNGGQYSQTPLHMLSQVATANQTAQQQGQNSAQGEWTFNTPFPVEYGRTPHPDHPDSRFPVNAQQQQSSTYPPPPDSGAAYADGFDPATNPWLWGSNFQQAMDLNLAAMEGISGGGMDGLFLGDGFGFNGESQ
ncbi:hypothetical protein AC578_8351 [Pseudocercospora eumusae]|uniref:Zn(2)-C6 fungal-type domain-containing protein n=1 Tax=Pseudocercospora eumusae TaxID=321146 RepID=A0A139HS56_9PEZI|nr:hypothetical protein AC578_8351 [Pseudocercospora eumusae]